MSFLEHQGRTLCYRLLGDPAKPLMLLAHPLGMNQTVWDEMLPALLGHFRTLTWDLPGHGSSSAWPEQAVTAADLAAEALTLAAVAGRRTLPFRRHFDRRHHRPTTALPGPRAAGLGHPDQHRRRHRHPRSLAAPAGNVRARGLAAMAHEIVPRWFGAAAREQQPALLAGWTVAMARGDAHSYAQLCEMLAGTDFRDTLGRPDVPIRLVAGADDLATPPESLASLARITGSSEPGGSGARRPRAFGGMPGTLGRAAAAAPGTGVGASTGKGSPRQRLSPQFFSSIGTIMTCSYIVITKRQQAVVAGGSSHENIQALRIQRPPLSGRGRVL